MKLNPQACLEDAEIAELEVDNWTHENTIETAATELASLRQQLEQVEGDYQRIVTEVLKCDPIPACKREDDRLEPPWEVIARIRQQLEQARADSERLMAIHELVNVHFSTEDGDGEPVLTRIETIARAAIDKSKEEGK